MGQSHLLRPFEAVVLDTHYALRGMRRSPGFTAVVIATLALAIGANCAIFSVVDALLVRPLPYEDAGRLVMIDATREVTGAAAPVPASFALSAAQEWERSLRSFERLGFFSAASFELSTRDGAEILDGATVTPSFFSTLGGAIVAGRALTPDDALTPSMVISHRLAVRLFGDADRAIGGHLTLNARPFTVIGVAGPDWNLPSERTDVWDSAAFARTINPRCCSVRVVARLKPGVGIASADADVRDTARRLQTGYPRDFEGVRTAVVSLRRAQLGNGRTVLLLLWAAVGIVLVIACTNVLNLLIARDVTRLREVAILQALGASRKRLLLQGLTESAVMVAAALLLGLVMTQILVAMLAAVDSSTFPQLHRVRMNANVVAFAIAVAAATMFATGAAPALRTADAQMPRGQNSTPTRRHRRLQQMLCAAQLAAAAILMVCSALLGRSFVNLLGTDLGVTPEHVVTASVNAALGQPHTATELASTLQRVVERVELIPGVEAAGVGTSLPPNQSRLAVSLVPDGTNVEYLASAVSCTPGYFRALGIRLVKGRLFTSSDDATHPPVIILSATTARHLFPDRDAIGQTFAIPKFQYALTTSKDALVVGVVSDVKFSGMDAAPGDQIYWSLPQAPWLSAFLTVRTSEKNIAPALRTTVASVDRTVAITSIKSLEDILATSAAPSRFRTTVFVLFASVAVIIAAIGLYAIVAYSVSQRTAEIGIRMALGASAAGVMRIVFREAIGVAVLGLVVGLPAAYLLARAFSALLFGVGPSNPLTYAGSAAALFLIAVAASYPSARRAAGVDPLIALKSE